MNWQAKEEIKQLAKNEAREVRLLKIGALYLLLVILSGVLIIAMLSDWPPFLHQHYSISHQ